MTLGTAAAALVGVLTAPIGGAESQRPASQDTPAGAAAAPSSPAASDSFFPTVIPPAVPGLDGVAGSRGPAADTTSAAPSRIGDGDLVVVPGTAGRSGSGPVRRYAVEVEQGLGVDPAVFAETVHATLGDPRSWGADGAMSFERVDATGDEDPQFRVTLASADTTDELCAPLRTRGELSCHNRGRAVINVERWLDATEYNPDLTTYRQYVVNHEVGHALGRGHESCPGAGEVAPVMMQQTKGIAPCLPNAWPSPDAG